MTDYYELKEKEIKRIFLRIALIVVVALCFLLAVGGYIIPKWNVWSQGMSGLAELTRAESNRKIAVQEAQAKRDSAVLLSEAEVLRAEGVAKANKIIGDSLAGNEAYLHYLWIQELASSGHVIYVPTEAGLPILEAGGRNLLGESKNDR